MALRLIQPLTEMSTRNISWGSRGKGGRRLGLTTLPPLCADCLEIWEPHPPGTLSVSPGLSQDSFTFALLLPPRLVLRCFIALVYVAPQCERSSQTVGGGGEARR